jgi:hypothetical protein
MFEKVFVGSCGLGKVGRCSVKTGLIRRLSGGEKTCKTDIPMPWTDDAYSNVAKREGSWTMNVSVSYYARRRRS